MAEVKRIIINEDHEFFNTKGMYYKEFSSDYRQIRYYTLLIVQQAPPEIKERNLLEQQISEIIKNAIKHGNKRDISKRVKVWYAFSPLDARLIVEDEGEGFKKIEEWNRFNEKRVTLFENGEFERLAEYVSFRTDRSDEYDGGNALFAAVEFWNRGVVFNNNRNCVAVRKSYPCKFRSIGIGDIEE